MRALALEARGAEDVILMRAKRAEDLLLHLSHVAPPRVVIDRGPPSCRCAMLHEEREQPALEPEGDTCRRGRLAIRQPDVERLAEERLVQIERRRSDGVAAPIGQEQLVLQLLEPLQDVLGARTRREERVRRHDERRLEIERPREVRYALGGALEETCGVVVGADADDLAHRERPASLERGVARALMTPALRLRSHDPRLLDARAGERGIYMVANRWIERGLRRCRCLAQHLRFAHARPPRAARPPRLSNARRP